MSKETVWYVSYANSRTAFLGSISHAASLIAMVGSGVYLKSTLIETIGFIFFCLFFMSRVRSALGERTSFNTPQQLANEIKRRYGVTAE